MEAFRATLKRVQGDRFDCVGFATLKHHFFCHPELVSGSNPTIVTLNPPCHPEQSLCHPASPFVILNLFQDPFVILNPFCHLEQTIVILNSFQDCFRVFSASLRVISASSIQKELDSESSSE